jgi:UDP-N-acetylmuramoyl-L-alanyl-D-glutamate--2,6-diaminopimelate ligase
VLLKEVLYKAAVRSVQGSTDVDVKDVQIDSKKVTRGSAFVAIKGNAADGHQFIEKAISAGALAVICEVLPAEIVKGVTYVQTENSAAAAGYMAHNFYGRPSEKMKVTGVTGTNGKTTITTLLYKLFTSLGYQCGLISTVENRVGKHVLPATHTTPDAVSLNVLLKQMLNENCTHVFMEVSSHAIQQQRVAGLHFAAGVFSNITHDHLDYHKTFDEYIRVKKSFFDALPAGAVAISNADDKRGTVMLQNTKAKKYFYALKTMAEFKGKILENRLDGLMMNIHDQEVHFRLLGEFNAYNLLAVYAAALNLGAEKSEVLKILSGLDGAEGRMDCIVSDKERIMAIVDYAHTPDALLNVLATIKSVRKGNEQIITVVGCGGDRDKTKRPLMAEAACAQSDKVIFTSDNPRSENPEQILKDMIAGLGSAAKKKYISMVDRKEAIKTAVSLAKAGDIILVAGKGHEKYQEIKGVKYEFDDKQIVKEMLEMMDK